MLECVHADVRYVRRTRQDGAIHYAVQCFDCTRLIKTTRHKGKLLIKHSEIPSGSRVFDALPVHGGEL